MNNRAVDESEKARLLRETGVRPEIDSDTEALEQLLRQEVIGVHGCVPKDDNGVDLPYFESLPMKASLRR